MWYQSNWRLRSMTWGINQYYVGNSDSPVCTSTSGCKGSIPVWGTKIPHAARCGQKKKVNLLCNGTPIKMMNSDAWVSLLGGNAPWVLPQVDAGKVMHPDPMGSRPRKLTFRTSSTVSFMSCFSELLKPMMTLGHRSPHPTTHCQTCSWYKNWGQFWGLCLLILRLPETSYIS